MAYLTAQITLRLAGFKPGMTVLAPAIHWDDPSALAEAGQTMSGRDHAWSAAFKRLL